MSTTPLFPLPEGLEMTSISQTAEELLVHITSHRSSSPCPLLSLDMSYPPFSMKVSKSRTRQDACIRQMWSLKEITGSRARVRFPSMEVKHSLHRGLAYLFPRTAKKTTAIAQSLPFHNHLTTLLYAADLIHYQSALYLWRNYRIESETFVCLPDYSQLHKEKRV